MWQTYPIHTDSFFFPIFSKVVKMVPFNQPYIVIAVKNQEKSQKMRADVIDKYKFNFEWQDENTVGVDVFKLIGEEEEDAKKPA